MTPDTVVCYRMTSPTVRLAEWLDDAMDRIVLVTGSTAAEQYAPDFPRLHAVADYATSPRVEQILDELCADGDIRRIVQVTEDDILRCGRVRDRHGVPGLGYDGALPWRDKLVMKQWTAAAGIPVPEFVAPASAEAADRFAARVGFPVVVKPRRDYASHGVRVVHDREALRAAVRGRDTDDVLVESFVDGEMFHVDGFVDDGRIVHVEVSRYLNNCLSFNDALPLGSMQLDRGSGLHDELTAVTASIVAALPDPGFCAIHLELFRPPGGPAVFCEIACRLGGGRVVDALTRSTGVDPLRLWIRHQAGVEDGREVPLGTRPGRYGWVLWPTRPGLLREVRVPDRPFLHDVRLPVTTPHRFDGAHSSSDWIATAVVSGDDEDDLEKNVRAAMELGPVLGRWEP